MVIDQHIGAGKHVFRLCRLVDKAECLVQAIALPSCSS
jgi:hypothetical protein